MRVAEATIIGTTIAEQSGSKEEFVEKCKEFLTIMIRTGEKKIK